MNRLTRHVLASVVATAVLLAGGATAASAQTIGTFSFALAPYCNNAVMTVTQEGNTYRLAGWDDNCGAGDRFPLTGTIAPNANGTLNISFIVVRTNGIAVDTSIRNFNLGGYQGNWTDSAGNSGTSGIVGLSAPAQGGTPRPAPSSAVPSNSINTTNIIDNSITAVDVDPTQVQLRVSGSCAVGQAILAINQNGTVVCGTPKVTTAFSNEQSIVNGITGTCEDLDGVNLGTVVAGKVSCTATVTANFNHTTTALSALDFDMATTATTCSGLQKSRFEMPAEAPSTTGHDVTVPVHRTFDVPAGALIVYLNGRTNGISANVLATNLSCTHTPQ